MIIPPAAIRWTRSNTPARVPPGSPAAIARGVFATRETVELVAIKPRPGSFTAYVVGGDREQARAAIDATRPMGVAFDELVHSPRFAVVTGTINHARAIADAFGYDPRTRCSPSGHVRLAGSAEELRGQRFDRVLLVEHARTWSEVSFDAPKRGSIDDVIAYIRAASSEQAPPVVPCGDCKGSGVYVGFTAREACPTCGGSKVVASRP